MNTFYEFFAGGGMARAGLGRDWTCLFANDFSDTKARSYVENWGAKDLMVGDIFDIGLHQVPGNADLAWGSFPCQDLSVAGFGAGLKGGRSSAFWGFRDIVHGLRSEGRKPRTVVLENVYGAMTANGGSDFDAILRALQAEEYFVGALVMDAVHFVPQSRPRLFVIAVDKNLAIPGSAVELGPNELWHPDAVVRAFGRLPSVVRQDWRWWAVPAPELPVERLEDLIEMHPVGVKWHSPTETARILDMMTELNRKKVSEAQQSARLKVGTIYRRTRLGVQRAEVRFDGIAGCLRTPSGGSSRQTLIVVDGSSVRTRLISPREAARLMGLPETYKLPPRYNDAYHLAGDGVAVPVVSHIEKYLLSPILSWNRAGTFKDQSQTELASA